MTVEEGTRFVGIPERDTLLSLKQITKAFGKTRAVNQVSITIRRGEVFGLLLYVTHDQSEAFGLCDRIAVMSEGKILQVGTPCEVYAQPTNLLVSRFLGFNILLVRQLGHGTETTAEFETVGGECKFSVCTPPASGRCGSEDLAVAIRPEDVTFH